MEEAVQKDLKKELERLPDGPTRNQSEKKDEAFGTYFLYSTEAFCGDDDLHKRAKDAALSIQCAPPFEFATEPSFRRLSCACGICNDCPNYARPFLELTANHPIKFYSFKTLPTCPKCGGLVKGTKTCPYCSKKKHFKKQKKKGELPRKLHCIIEEKPFQEFWVEYIDELKKFKMHHF